MRLDIRNAITTVAEYSFKAVIAIVLVIMVGLVIDSVYKLIIQINTSF